MAVRDGLQGQPSIAENDLRVVAAAFEEMEPACVASDPFDGRVDLVKGPTLPGARITGEVAGTESDHAHPLDIAAGQRGEKTTERPLVAVVAERQRFARRVDIFDAVDGRAVLQHAQRAVLDKAHAMHAKEAAPAFERRADGGCVLDSEKGGNAKPKPQAAL